MFANASAVIAVFLRLELPRQSRFLSLSMPKKPQDDASHNAARRNPAAANFNLYPAARIYN
jgi:hypothetical protein